MKKSTKKRLSRSWQTVTRHPNFKKLGIVMILACTFAYVLYQTVTMVGIIKSF